MSNICKQRKISIINNLLIKFPSIIINKNIVRGYLGSDANKGIEIWINDSSGSSQSMAIEGGPLSYAYKLYKIEIHSASSSNSGYEQQQQQFNGKQSSKSVTIDRDEDKVSELLKTGKRSEHLIDGRDFDGELQLHFYNGEQLANGEEARRIIEEASDKSERANLFASVSIFIQKTTSTINNSINYTSSNQQQILVNEFLSTLSHHLAKQWDQSQQISTELTSKNELQFKQSQLDALLTSKTEFVTYQGSLNRPPCNENVDWIILNRSLRIKSQLFDQLLGTNNNLSNQLNTNQNDQQQQQQQQQQSDNVRPVKARHGRLLRTSINVARSAAMLDRSLACQAKFSTNSIRDQFKVCIV